MNRDISRTLLSAVRSQNILALRGLQLTEDEASHTLWAALLPDEHGPLAAPREVLTLLALGAQIDYLPTDRSCHYPEKERTIHLMLGLSSPHVRPYLHALLGRGDTSAQQIFGHAMNASALYNGLPRQTLAVLNNLLPEIDRRALRTDLQAWLDGQKRLLRLVA